MEEGILLDSLEGIDVDTFADMGLHGFDKSIFLRDRLRSKKDFYIVIRLPINPSFSRIAGRDRGVMRISRIFGTILTVFKGLNNWNYIL